jgi:hypothetical protein
VTVSSIAENNYASIGTVPLELLVTSGVLHWNTVSDLGPIYYEMVEIDLASSASIEGAVRAIPVAIIEGYQVRPETLADLGDMQIGSEEGRRWSIEGPMDDPDQTENASVRVEWRWTSGSSLSGVDYVPYEPGEVYFRKCQFRLRWERPLSTFDTKLERFTVNVSVPALFSPADFDGGTF